MSKKFLTTFSQCVSAVCRLARPKRSDDEVTTLSKQLGRSKFNSALRASSHSLGFNRDLVYLGKTRWGHKFRWKESSKSSSEVNRIRFTAWLPLGTLEHSFGLFSHFRKSFRTRLRTEEEGLWLDISDRSHPSPSIFMWCQTGTRVVQDNYWEKQQLRYDSDSYAKLPEDTKNEMRNIDLTLRRTLSAYPTSAKPSVSNG
jgi:hypothetical protein